MGHTSATIHCEIAPVLVNRTAVYRMCRMIPAELKRRGFRVRCSALLSRIPAGAAKPDSVFQRWLFRLSRYWLLWASRRPGWFNRTRRLVGFLLRWRHAGGTTIYLDPLYLLFYGVPDRGVVLVYDVTTVTDPGWHPPGVAQLYAVAFQQLAWSRCRIVVACQNTADHLRINWGVAPSRINIVPLAGFSQAVPSAEPASTAAEPFLLFVGSLDDTRKNIQGLIHAYDRSELYWTRGVRLRLIGRLAQESPVKGLARRTPGVDLLGFVDDGQLVESYRSCLAFVYPSFCEGFGLPLLEAMSHGCVCLTTTTGASPEIAGDAAIYANPYDAHDLIEKLRQIAALGDVDRERFRIRARQRASQYSWERFHDSLVAVLRAEGAQVGIEPTGEDLRARGVFFPSPLAGEG